MTSDDLKHFRLPVFKLTPAEKQRLAATVIQTLKERWAEHRNAADGEAKEYSPYGPIYIPLSGVRDRSGNMRYARSMRGRYSLTKRGLKKREQEWRASKEETEAYGEEGYDPSGIISRSGMSYKFRDYADFKMFIGHSGERDLMLSGAMQASISLVEETDTEIAIGFLSDEQEKKMKGNDNRDPTWGMSEEDRNKIEAVMEAMLEEKLNENGLPE